MSEDTQDAFERGFMLGFDEGVKQGRKLGKQALIEAYPKYPYSPIIWCSTETPQARVVE